MSIPMIGAISGVTGTGYADAAGAVTSGAAAGGSASGAQFSNVLTSSLESLQGLQATSDRLAVRAVTGDLNDVHDYTIAASEAKLSLELTAAVRNKAVEAFSEIMRMQA